MATTTTTDGLGDDEEGDDRQGDGAVFYSPPRVPMECSWTPHSPHGVLMECSWSLHRVLMEPSWSAHRVYGVHGDSMRTPPKIHKFYGEAMDFWSFGEIYPCRSVIVSILILAHFVTASTLQVDGVIYLQTHILFFLILAESLKRVIHNEKLLLLF
jgi:hypothetical protein